MQNAAWDMSRAHSSGQALQDARCPSASLLHGYSWRIVYGTYDGSNHYKNLTLQVRFNPRSLRLSHCITCWPVLANIAENLPHALNHIMVSFKDMAIATLQKMEVLLQSFQASLITEVCHHEGQKKSGVHFSSIVGR